MAKSAQLVSVGKRTLDLTNLEKILYPEDHIVKALIVDYYLRLAPTLLRYAKGRPLTLVRLGAEPQMAEVRHIVDSAPLEGTFDVARRDAIRLAP